MGEANFYYFTCLKLNRDILKESEQDGGSDGTCFPKAEECLLEQQGRPHRWAQGQEDPLREERRIGLQDPDGGQGGQLHRQEVPLHRTRPDSRKNSQWRCSEAQDATHRRHQKRLPSLHQKIQAFREEAQEYLGPSVSLLP